MKATTGLFCVIILLILQIASGQNSGTKPAVIDSLKSLLHGTSEGKRAAIYNGISKAYLMLHNDSCLLYARLVLSNKTPGLWSEHLTAYDNQSKWYWNKKSIDTAFAFLDTAIAIGNRHNSYNDISYFENITGVYYWQLGQYSQALNHFSKSLEAMERTGNEASIASGLNNISACNIRLGNYEKALEASLKSLKIKEMIGSPKEIGLALLNIGGIHTELNNNEKAIEYYFLALAIFEKLNDPVNQGKCLNNLGNNYKKMNDFAKARVFYEKALLQYKNSGEINIRTSLLRNIAMMDLDEGKTEEAMKKYQLSLQLCEEANDAFGKANSKYGIGKAMMVQQSIGKAIKYLRESATEAKNIGAFETRLESHHLLSECYEKSGNFGEALKEYKIFAQLTDTLLNKEKIKNINELQVRYETENKENQIKILTQQGEIDRLEISKQNQQLTGQRNIIVATVVFVLLIAIILYLIFNRFRLKQLAEKERAERKSLETEGRLLRTQMNPHFLFNSLNSIQSYISEADTFMAETYLSKFARLVRSILEHSRKNLVNVSDDLKALKLYLEIEQLRFKDKFDFFIETPDEFLDNEYFIPPMLIQPFAENAIIHGLRPKAERGYVIIRLKKDNDLIVCTVEDNGIGRLRSMELNRNKVGKSSLGMQVTCERLKVLKQQINNKADVQILDLTDEAGNPTGTRVTLWIPYEQDV